MARRRRAIELRSIQRGRELSAPVPVFPQYGTGRGESGCQAHPRISIRLLSRIPPGLSFPDFGAQQPNNGGACSYTGLVGAGWGLAASRAHSAPGPAGAQEGLPAVPCGREGRIR